ncbi:MAG TPA: hypothetical protein VK404_05005 [Spirosoma sp.]|nr:hypothetical protein [Spirosoma sp.]
MRAKSSTHRRPGRVLYSVSGLSRSAKKHALGSYTAGSQSAKVCLSVLTHLKQRGLDERLAHVWR